MLEQMLMPLDRHFDGGFQGLGDAFREAAGKLAAQEESRALNNPHLPINFLYRHSVELFLKSMIVTIHRVLKLPTADGPHSPDPKIKVEGKWRPITTIHSVKTLRDEFGRLVAINRSAMDERDASEWKFDDELRGWIETIENFDPNSTFSRYVQSNSDADSTKSGFVAIEPVKMVERMRQEKSGTLGTFVLARVDDDDEIVDVFTTQDNPLAGFRDTLVQASNCLYGSALGLHAELVDGMGPKIKQWRAEAAAAANEAK